jgi:hypothetical protein
MRMGAGERGRRRLIRMKMGSDGHYFFPQIIFLLRTILLHIWTPSLMDTTYIITHSGCIYLLYFLLGRKDIYSGEG